jgi:hypothetical protein
MRYQDDVRVAIDLDSRIKKYQEGKEILFVALIGQHEPDIRHNFIQGQVIGHSFFGYGWDSPYEATYRGLDFMATLGLNYEKPSLAQMDIARDIAETMPSYPSEDCIRKSSGMIVIKLSPSVYEIE